ncbi:MAG TPA: OsmC family protein [Candidatus Limnocylindrales bacterium]|jgi:putative redox protein
MKRVSIDWQPDLARFEAHGGHAGQTIAVNAPHEEGGPTGFSASELLLASAGTCSAWDVIEVLRKQRQRVTDLQVSVEGDQAPDPPWPYVRVRLHFTVTGHGLDIGKVRKAVELSERKYCAVIGTIRASAEVSCEVEVREADQEPAAIA